MSAKQNTASNAPDRKHDKALEDVDNQHDQHEAMQEEIEAWEERNASFIHLDVADAMEEVRVITYCL